MEIPRCSFVFSSRVVYCIRCCCNEMDRTCSSLFIIIAGRCLELPGRRDSLSRLYVRSNRSGFVVRYVVTMSLIDMKRMVR